MSSALLSRRTSFHVLSNPAAKAAPKKCSTLARLEFLVRRMEEAGMARLRSGRRRWYVRKDIARDVLLAAADVVALVGLHRPPRDRLTNDALDALEIACGRNPRTDNTPQDIRWMRRVDAAIAAEGGAS